MSSLLPPQSQQQPQEQQRQQQAYTTMEDDGVNSLSPPGISSDDMDIEPSSLSDDSASPTSIAVASAPSVSAVPALRLDAETQCDTTLDVDNGDSRGEEDVSPMDAFISSLTKHDQHHQHHQQQQQDAKEANYGRHDVESVNKLLFDR